MDSLDAILSSKLERRERENNLRSLSTSSNLIDFVSNDYLSLARSSELKTKIATKIESFPVQNGSTGSRLLSGNSDYIVQVETKLAHIFLAESAIIFNSGYSANLAILSSIPQKGDTIIYDELSHASLKDGARLSHAKRFSFRHNDLNDLESKIRNAEGNVFVVVESIYSMDGDVCPLQELVHLKNKLGFYLIVDEAHSTGICGQGGSGMIASMELQNYIDIRVYTFGKAMGIHGACVVGSNKLKQHIVNFARPFIYTTAPSLHSLASVECAFDFIDEAQQQTLHDRIAAFVKHASVLGPNKLTPIQTVMFPGNSNVKKACEYLQGAGFDVRPILAPTVPVGKERIRITLHLHNTTEEILELTNRLIKYKGDL